MTRRPWIALAAALAVASAAPAADKEAVGVIEKAIKAHGGLEVHKKYPAREVAFEGTMTLPTEKVKVKSVAAFALPDKSHDVIELVDRKSVVEVIVNGDKFKQLINGKVEELKDEALKAEYKQTLAIQDVTQFYPLLDGDKYALKMAKDELVGDKDTSAVLVSRKGMKDLKMNFDKESGRLLKFSFKSRSPFDTRKEVEQETVQSDFRDFAGMSLPTALVVKHDGKEFMTLKVTDVKLLEKADPKTYKVD